MKLEQWLDETGKTSAEVASALGVSGAAVSYWTSGKRRPTINNCVRLYALTDGAVGAADYYPELAQMQPRRAA